jgi:hypothetical protein
MLRIDPREEKMELQNCREQSEGKKVSVLEHIQEKKAMIEKDTDRPLVARIDYLSSRGKVFCSLDFAAEDAFLRTVKEDLHDGVPLVVVLYRDPDGKTISKDFLEDLDTLPKELKEEDQPSLRSPKDPPLEL